MIETSVMKDLSNIDFGACMKLQVEVLFYFFFGVNITSKWKWFYGLSHILEHF